LDGGRRTGRWKAACADPGPCSILRPMRLRLQEVLAATGVSRRELAQRMGRTHQHISYILKHRRCNFATVSALALALGIPEQELIQYQSPSRTVHDLRPHEPERPAPVPGGGRWYLAWEPVPGQNDPSAEAPADTTDPGGTA